MPAVLAGAALLAAGARAEQTPRVQRALSASEHVTYRVCPPKVLYVGGHGGPLAATDLAVSRITCRRAAATLEGGRYVATPDGPLFSAKGYICSFPLPDQSAANESDPPYYRCRKAEARFRFLMPG